MWVIYFLLVVPLAESAVLGTKLVSVIESLEDSVIYRNDMDEIKNKMEKTASDFLEDLIGARNPHSQRQKREISDTTAKSLADKKGVFRLSRIKPYLSVCNRPRDISFVDVGNSSYTVCISTAAEDTPTTANVAQVTDKGIVQLDSWFTSNPSRVVSFHDGDQIYILMADSGRGDGTDLMRFNLYSNRAYVDHTVNSKYATAIALWKTKMNGSYHLAIANSAGNDQASDLTTEIFTYNWMGTYFDKYSAITAYDVKDIEPFHIHNMAYLAVANHRRGKENYHVDSEIFKYNLDQEKWRSLQKIRTYGAMDWEFFTLGKGTGKEFYLAAANYVEQGNHNINSVIYKFVKDKFVPFQCLLTSGAVSIAAFSDGSKFLLAIANEFEGVHLYQYDGWRFVPASVQFTYSTMSQGVTSVSFHTIMSNSMRKLVLAVSNPKMYGESLYEVEFAHENVLGRWHDESTEWCLHVLDNVEKSESGKTIIDMKNVIYTDQKQPILISGNLDFQNGFQALELSTPKFIDVQKGKTYDDSLLLKLKELKERLEVIELKLQKANDILFNAVTLNGDQTLTGNYEFKELAFNCESCHFANINADLLNGDEVLDLKKNVVFLDEEEFIDQPLNIEKIQVYDLDVRDLLDGVNVSNAVTKSGVHHISGTKTFTSPINSKVIQVSGLVDGVNVTPQTVLLNGGFQNATGNLTFVDIDTSYLEVSSFVNGVDLDAFYRNMMLSDKSYVVSGRKTFTDLVVEELHAKLINGVDLNDLWNNIMWVDKPQEVTAPMTLSTVSVENHLKVAGNVNGLKIPGPLILFVDSSVEIVAPKLFKQTTRLNRLDVTSSINGIGIVDDGSGKKQLDILLKDGSQIISGKKTFGEIFLDNHSYVSGTVNGIDLSEFQKSALRKNHIDPEETFVFNDLHVKGPLTVHGNIGDINLDQLYNRGLMLSDSAMPDFDSVTFQDGFRVIDLQSNDINGVDVTTDLVYTKIPQIIRGRKEFQDINLEANSFATGLVNNLDISFLKETILTLGNQVISVPKTLDGNLRIRNLTIKGLVNNVDMRELVTLNGQEVITGSTTLKDVNINGNLYTKNLEVAGLVNGIDIDEMVHDTLTYGGVQMVSGIKTVTGKITLANNSNLNTDSLNDIDMSSLWEDAVLVDIPQNISGKKVFTKPISFGNVWFHNSVDGVTDYDLKDSWLFRDADQEVLGDLILSRGAEVSDLSVSGYVNDVNITELNNTIVRKNEPTIISGPAIFDTNVISYGDVTLTGKIQKVDLSEETVLKSDENVMITGEKEFLADVSISGDLFVAGSVDGVSIKDFCDSSIFLKGNHSLTDLVVEGNVVFEDGVKIGGLLAGVDINTLYGISLKENEAFIDGVKTFENLTVEGNIHLFGKVGGVELQFLNKTYMSLTRDQEIVTSHHFDHVEVHGAVSTSHFYTHDNVVNNISVGQLEKRSLKKTGSQKVTATYRFDKVTFADDVMVVGRVNSIEVPKGLMRRNRANYVYTSKVFQNNVTVLGDLTVEDGKTIQDVDVSEWKSKSVLKNGGHYEIDGFKRFTSITANDLRVHGSVNGVKISEDSLLTIYGDQIIVGKKHIIGEITVPRNLIVDGLINGANIQDIVNRAARRGYNNTFTGVKFFKQPIIVGALETGLISGVDILKLNKVINTKFNFEDLSSRMDEMNKALYETGVAINNQAVLLKYYEYFQGFEIPGSYLWHYIYEKDTREILLLSDISLMPNDCTSVKIFTFDSEKHNFVIKGQLLASYAVGIKSIYVWNSTFVFIANRMPSGMCSSDKRYVKTLDNGTTPGNVFTWDRENSMFTAYQTIWMEPTSDVAVFSYHDLLCAVYTEVKNTNLYCARKDQKTFVLKESLPTYYGQKISLIQDTKWPNIRLAIASAGPLDDNYVDIYMWKNTLFGHPVQRIKTTNAQSVMFIPYSGDHLSTTFLVISESTIAGVRNAPRLMIYRADESKNKFIKYQEIKDAGHLDYIELPRGNLILFVLDTVGNVKIYRYKQAEGFVKEHTLLGTDAQTLRVFRRMESPDSSHYLALAGPQSILPVQSGTKDFSKILKSKIKGRFKLN